ncbi:MAG: hypothetical protein ACJ769_02165 [Chloroflexota bacterium]
MAGMTPGEGGVPAPRPVVPPAPPDAARQADPAPHVEHPTNGATPPQATGPAFVPHAAPPHAAAEASANGRSLEPVTPAPPTAMHQPPPHAQTNGAMNGGPNGMNGANAQCTAPQLRRFIKSRPYVPMHELRRRFGIDGGDDDVTPVRLDPGWVYVGLPGREGGLLGELLKAGEIGYELSLDPRSPIVIGVYPMRPIPRG